MFFYNVVLQWGTEPREFDLMIDLFSADIRLKTAFELEN
jgi:hypothetical protein